MELALRKPRECDRWVVSSTAISAMARTRAAPRTLAFARAARGASSDVHRLGVVDVARTRESDGDVVGRTPTNAIAMTFEDRDDANASARGASASEARVERAASPFVDAHLGQALAFESATPFRATFKESAVKSTTKARNGFQYMRDDGGARARTEARDATAANAAVNANANANVNVNANASANANARAFANATNACDAPYANVRAGARKDVELVSASGRKVETRERRESREGRATRHGDDDGGEFVVRDIAFGDFGATSNANATPFGGVFTTGSGKRVEISEDALRRARERFGDGATGGDRASDRGEEFVRGHQGNDAEAPSASASIFQTAGGKAVHISEERLRQSRAFLDSKENDGAATNTPLGKTIMSSAPFPQPSFKTPSSLPPMRNAPKAPGFTPPIRKTGGFTPPTSKLATKAAASAPRPGTKRERSTGDVVSVHDLFQSRARMGMRAPLCTFFNGLKPFQDRPVAVDACVKSLSADTAKALLLPSVERGLVGWRELRESMLKAGAREGLCTPAWAANAYKWIIWTHASIARAFPEKLAFGILSESSVLRRMLYRYEREINRAERPHLRKVMEKDDNSGAPAVLVVSAIRSMSSTFSVGSAPKVSEVEVSDGWYSMRARLDAMLTSYVGDGRLAVGHKIFIVGAELRGVTDAVAPLSEESEMAYLMLNVNGTRLAPWDATLGRVPYTLTVPLRTVVPDGGVVPRMIVHVRRVYPLMYQERREDGTSVLRCELAERRALVNWHGARESVMHDVQETMQHRRDGWSDGGDAEDAMRDALENKNLSDRRTSLVLRLNVVGYNPALGHPQYRGPRSLRGGSSSAMVTVWDADASLVDAVRAGQTYVISALRPRPTPQCAECELSLSTTRFTRWIPVDDATVRAGQLEHSESMWRCVSVDASVDLRDLSRSGLPRKEFDAVVCPLFKGPTRVVESGRQSQWIFCLDASARVEGASTNEAHLLAIEVSGRADDTFIDADEWTAAAASMFGDTDDGCGSVVLLSNLVYMNYDAENNVHAAKVMMEDVVVQSLASARPGVSREHDAAHALEQWRNNRAKSRSMIAALKRRARLLTGTAEAEAEAAWDVNASQQQQSQYDPPRLSADFDDWNDDFVAEELANAVDVATRTLHSNAHASTESEDDRPRTRRRSRSSRSSRGS